MLAFISFVGFTALVAVIAWWYTKNEDLSHSEGYYLAGRSLTAVFIAGSMMLTNLSTEHLVGLNGLAYRSGFIVMAWEVMAAITIAIFAFYFLAGVFCLPSGGAPGTAVCSGVPGKTF